jgi:CubicO group peptidase (beta-lactamase class C family)
MGQGGASEKYRTAVTYIKTNRPVNVCQVSRSVLGLFILIVVSSQISLVATPLPQAPAYWPTNGWRSSTPEQQGIDSVKLADALDYIRQHDINIHSLLLVRNGYVVLDAYFYPYDEKSIHDLASVTKSVTSTLIGIAIDQGKLKSVLQEVPELFAPNAIANQDERKARLTLASLLSMTSGLKCQPEENELTLHRMMESRDWVQFMLDLPMAEEPGSKFVYCSGGMHLLSGIISKTAGMSAFEFARRSLFEPLGIHDAVWPADPHGVNHGWGDLHLHPRDMAKLGYLYLNHGMWDGKRIISSDWIADSTRVHAHTGSDSDYGYGWWVRPKDKLYEAVGRGGQRITVLPELNLVAVETGGGFEPGDVGALLVQALKSDRPLPENPAGVARLHSALRTSTLPPASKPVPPMSQMAAKVSGKTYEMGPNPIGLQKISLTFSPHVEASVRLRFADGRSEVRPIGLDGVARISPNGRYGLPVAIRARWQDAHSFVLDYDEVANINDYRFTLNFHENVVSVDLSERTADVTVSFEGTMKDE